ncbi:MAG: hypothetical protein WA989_10585 [Henriciella sp.]|uniref:hypothetical protein n=1 Tax=Henriciella sp. TaxID=1968823 RepID=UPI003C7251F8
MPLANQAFHYFQNWYREFGALAVSLALPLSAWPEPVTLYADIGTSTIGIDRGEQISDTAVELNLGADFALEAGQLYVALYRLTPVGPYQSAYDDEVDYTAGFAWSGRGYEADVSANWLTYPGEESEPSLEVAGAIALDLPLAPELAGFVDADTNDRGLELTAGPHWQAGNWEFDLRGRVGLVEPGGGGASRSYAGIEGAALYPLSRTVLLGTYIRAEWADQDSFVRRYDNAGASSAFASQSVAAGIVLAWTGQLK